MKVRPLALSETIIRIVLLAVTDTQRGRAMEEVWLRYLARPLDAPMLPLTEWHCLTEP